MLAYWPDPAVDQPPVCSPQLLLSVEAQLANTSAPLVSVVILAILTSVVLFVNVARFCVTSIAQVLLLIVGRNTCIDTVVAVLAGNDTLGLADQVPLYCAQNILRVVFVMPFAVSAVQVCPPVLEIAMVLEVSREFATRIIKSPACVPPAGVTATVDEPRLPPSDGFEEEP